MASTAITARNSILKIETAVVATTEPITAITKANPAVCTSTTHAFTNGMVITIDGVVGMTELNGRVFVVGGVATDTFNLLGVDSTDYTTYTSGGTATAYTMSKIGNAKDFNLTQDEPQNIDVTNLDSVRQEFRIGLPGSWSATFNFDVDSAGTDAGQLELQKAMDDGLIRRLSVTLSNGKIWAGQGYIMSVSAQGSPGAVVGGSVRVRGTGQYNWFV